MGLDMLVETGKTRVAKDGFLPVHMVFHERL